jgi:hypothetical protein
MAMEAAIQIFFNIGSIPRHMPVWWTPTSTNFCGANRDDVAFRKSTTRWDAAGDKMFGSWMDTEAMTVGISSDRPMAKAHIQRVEHRRTRCARSAAQAPHASSSVTAMT